MLVRLVEQAVMNYPPGMDGWRMYRIEYGVPAERCIAEGVIWLPGDCDGQAVEDWLCHKARNTEK